MALAAPVPTVKDIEIVLTPEGGQPRSLKPDHDSMRWSTAAIGGFAAFSASFPGGSLWRDRVQLEGAMLRVTIGQRVLWEGRVEDPEYNLDQGSGSSAITGFGLRRLLAETGVRRVWIDRDIASKFATTIPFYPLWGMKSGHIDEEDSSVIGLEIRGDNSDPGQIYGPNVTGPWFWFPLPEESSFILPTALVLTVARSNTSNMASTTPSVIVEYSGFADEFEDLTASTDGTVNTIIFDQTRTLVRLRIGIRIGGISYENTDSDYMRFYDMRFLHAMTTEDDDGGFHGGTLLRDLIGFVPGLHAGNIAKGDEFLIQQLEHHARVPALSIAEEISAYYTHELAVWEDGRVDWTSPPDDPHWIIIRDQLESLNLQASLDRSASTTYVQFQDVLSDGRINEESWESTDRRNPYVRQGRNKHEILQAGFPMTSRSASALAQKLNAITGGPTPVAGRATLRADRVIRHADGSPMPAWAIRAGENILIADLPVSAPFRPGLDSQTLFHIVTCDVDLSKRTVTLELDAQTRRADTLMARLAAATRVVTG